MKAELDVEVYMKLPGGYGEMSGKVLKLEHALYEVKQIGRQRSALLCKTLVDTSLCLIIIGSSRASWCKRLVHDPIRLK